MTNMIDSNVQAAIDAGIGLAEPEALDDHGRFYSVVTPPGAEHRVVDLEEHSARFAARPRRKTGTATVHTADSLVEYLAKHALPETEIWANITTPAVTAVINAHRQTEEITDQGDMHEGPAGWGDHRCVLQLRHTPSWKAWRDRDGQLASQVEFAEFIEDRAVDIVSPPAAAMLELAQSFNANRQIQFDSSHRLSSGEVQLRYSENIAARAGTKGDMTIPERFELGLQPFEGSPIWKVNARLRYRINDGALRIGFALERPDDVLREAFSDITDDIGRNTGREVWHGVPD